MKPRTFFTGVFVLALALACAVPSSRAAETVQQDIVMELDGLGDGTITIAFKLSASQWTNWKAQYGERPDVLWRDLRQQFAAAALGKFTLEKNDVERTALAKLTVAGGTRRRSDGSQEVEIPKEMRKISESGREWIFSSVQQGAPGSPILTQTIRVLVPAEAVNVRLNQPGTAFQALVYEVPEQKKGGGMLFTGVGVLIAGLALGAVGFVPGKAQAKG